MKAKGIGGFLMFDSRGIMTTSSAAPAGKRIMDAEWRALLKHAMSEAHAWASDEHELSTLPGLCSCPGERSEWPKQLVWTHSSVTGRDA